MALYGTLVYGAGIYGDSGGPGDVATYGTGSYLDNVYGEGFGPIISELPDFQPVYTPLRRWKFILANSSDMSHIGELPAKSRSLQLALNRPGSGSFQVPISHDLSEEINPVTTCLKAYRDGVLIWSGPVWNTVESLPENTMQVSCIGWFEILNHRYLRYEKKYLTDLYNGGEIAIDLIAIANNQKDGPLSAANPDGDGTVRPTGIAVGTNSDTMIRNRTYPRWQNIGSAIQELTQIESGFDWTVDPETKTFDVYASAFGSGLGMDRTEVQFGYNWGPNNLRTFSRQFDASTLVTQHHSQGPYGLGTATAGGAPLDTYGLWEEQQQLSEVKDSDILLAYSVGEVAIRSVPRTIYSMTPFPYAGEPRVPEPFVDYKVGDYIYFTAKYAKRISIEKQAVRVYGMDVSVDEEGNETIGNLQLSPNF